MTAAQMAKQNLSDGLRMDLQDRGSQAEIAIYSNALTNVVYEEIAAELVRHTGWEPTVVIKGEDGAVRILFATAFGGRQTK